MENYEKIKAELNKVEWRIRDAEKYTEEYRQGIKNYIDGDLKGSSEWILHYAGKLDKEVKLLDVLYYQRALLMDIMNEEEN